VSLLLIKENKFEEIKEILEETKEKLSGLDIETFSVTLTEYIIQVKKFQDKNKVDKAISFMKNLPLFEEELKILYDYLGEEYKKEGKGESIKKEKLMEIDQIYGKLESKKGDARRDKDIIFNQRKPMRRRIYSPILELLEAQKYGEGAVKYLQLVKSFSKSKKFEISSLMILLQGLSFLKAEESVKLIKKNITEFLNSLGVNKKLIEETFYVMLILFIINVKIYSLEKYMPKIKGMLDLLPLFEEEKQLLDI
ncbi:MAG: hypothetical protein ACXAAH_06395, partial [Promethearchaeota archaeon]